MLERRGKIMTVLFSWVLCLGFIVAVCPILCWSQLYTNESSKEIDHDDNPVEEDWGDGLKILSIYKPEVCEHQAKENDVIHYHYVGRLASDGSVFGKSFDYNSPYIVTLGHSRIIPGMDRGLMGTCLWERRRISFPPHLGYGTRGVGDTIPPNASLVFYIRMIKIERNGHVLGEDADISSIWNSGLMSYSDQNWQQAVDMIEEALRLYYLYDNQTLLCLKECNAEDLLTNQTKKTLEGYFKEDPLIQQFAEYAAKGKCMRDCKAKNLPSQLRSPDPVIIDEFRRYVPYSFLHFSYYQIGKDKEAAQCCFTYLHLNPSDKLASMSLSYYRQALNLTENQYLYRDPAISSYRESYLRGVEAYTQKRWLHAVDMMEDSLIKFQGALSDCYLLCEDVINVNLTEPNMNTLKKDLLEEYGFKSDTMEYYELLVTAIKEVLKCFNNCYDRARTIDGYLYSDYLNSHFDYLQFSYFKLGNVYKAAESAATSLALEPSSDSMAENVRYFSKSLELMEEEVIPRKEIIQLHLRCETYTRLLYLAEHGEIKKKEGQMGDIGEPNTGREEL